ncbi:hypothetical protein E2C01_057826 [Portunus trituberculatus]|uniref:Uncharacterized protein n=1 Tax=Portunus trituberculatus TaxID=210409 RepID=A0A5B7H4G1_PORTR|nr:hypothetical protein [Portunus trituberculatus]
MKVYDSVMAAVTEDTGEDGRQACGLSLSSCYTPFKTNHHHYHHHHYHTNNHYTNIHFYYHHHYTNSPPSPCLLLPYHHHHHHYHNIIRPLESTQTQVGAAVIHVGALLSHGPRCEILGMLFDILPKVQLANITPRAPPR